MTQKSIGDKMPAYDKVTLPTCKQIPLHPNKVIKKTIKDVIGAVITLGFILLVFAALIISFAKWLGLLILVGLILLLVAIVGGAYFYQREYYRTYYYDLKKDLLVIRKGVFAPREISVPYERIQNVFVDRDILDTFFGLYDVHLETAAIGSGINAHIDGVDEGNATKLKDIILGKIKRKGSGL
jgi:membrane protein YdbS with pleckstrin-like domain